MPQEIKKIAVYIPHRISGFFEIVDEVNGVKITDPEKIGSRGAGFCLSAVGKTEIECQGHQNEGLPETEIYINGERLNEKAETTHFIVNYIRNSYKTSVKIRIKHYFELPVGCGYGASGSGALGTIFGLNYLLGLNLSYQERGRIAHIAEVENRTGLGTVCGQLGRGFCMLKEPGYPCIYEHIIIPEGIKIICGTFGMIHTKSILTDPVLNERIKQAGRRALEKLIQVPSMMTFIKESIKFVKATNMLKILRLEKTEELMENLNKLDIIGACMNQLGRSVYAIGYEKDIKEMIEVFETFKPEIKIFNLEINNNYPQILKIK